jgi:O-antigen/teichoic acid export membrane protein
LKPKFDRAAALSGALLMTGSTYVAYLLGLAVSILIARRLGPADFGRYSYLVWLSGLLVVVSNHGLTTSGIRFISESVGRGSPDAARNIHGHLRRWQFASVGLVTVVFLIALPWLRPAGWESRLWLFALIVVASTVAKSIFLFDISIAKGYGRFAVEAVCTVAVSLANALAVVVLVALGGSLIAFLGLFVVASLAYAVIAATMLGAVAASPQRAPLEATLLARMKQHLVWTMVLVVVGALSNKSIETLLLNATTGPAEVGYFAIAAALTRGGVEMLSSGLSTVLMPAMAHAYGAGGAQRVSPILSDAVRYTQFFGLLLAGVGVLWAGVAVNLLYGPRFEPVVDVFRVMVVVGGITLADGAFGALLTTTDHQPLRAGVAVFSVLVSAVCAFALVPRYGLSGAIAAHATSRLIVFSLVVAGIVKSLAVRLPWRELGRLVGSAALAAAVVALWWWMVPGPVGQAIAGFAYALIFVTASIALRAWQVQDVAMLGTLAKRFPAIDRRLRPMLERWQAGLRPRT